MSEDYSRHVARVVAAQVAEASGFDACQDSAVEVLGDLLLRYLSTLCSSSHGYAELAGRSQCNLADVMLALEDLGVTPEDLLQHTQYQVCRQVYTRHTRCRPAPATAAHHTPATPATPAARMLCTTHTATQASGVPFAHTLAEYPVHAQTALPPTFADRREPHAPHIPPFLPAFPDPHTYQHTAAFAGHATDPHKQRQVRGQAARYVCLCKPSLCLRARVCNPIITPRDHRHRT